VSEITVMGVRSFSNDSVKNKTIQVNQRYSFADSKKYPDHQRMKNDLRAKAK